MAKTSSTIDISALMVAGAPNKYITEINSDGIKVHAFNNPDLNYIKINSEGMEIYKSNESSPAAAIKIAEFKEHITLGTRVSSSTIGTGSIAMGTSVIASGNYSYAEGYHTTASGNYSHAEGWYTIASGAYSHAEGRSGQDEGEDLIASGTGSHAEGDCTRAIGMASHAGGQYSQANGNYSFTHGSNTIASSAFQAVFGKFNEEDSNAIFIIGNGTSDSQRSNLMTVGNDSIIIGKSSAAHTTLDANGQRFYAADGTTQLANIGYGEGTAQSGTATAPYYTFGTRASGSTVGNYSVAEGWSVKASGFASHAEGFCSIASGQGAHAEGGSSVSGGGPLASGQYSHAEGDHTVASSYCAHAEGVSTQASHQGTHSQNVGTIASKWAQTAMGKYNVEDPNQVVDPVTYYDRGKYALIIGNGTSGSARSNALTVDWDGNITVAEHSSPIGKIESVYTESSTNVNNETRTVVRSIQLTKGVWVVSGSASFATNTTGRRWLGLMAGTTNTITNDDTDNYVQAAPASGGATRLNLTRIIEISTNSAYVNLVAWHSTGAKLEVLRRQIYAVRIA